MELVYEFLRVHPYLSLLQTAFTIWMLVDGYRRGADSFWFWVVLIFQPIGPWVYFFAVKFQDFRAPQSWTQWRSGPSLAELRYRAEHIPTLTNHLALAQRLIERQEYEEAVPHLEAAMKTEPDHGQVLYLLALCHTRQGHPSQALPLLERLLERDPRWSNYQGLHLLIEAREGCGDHAGALYGCRELVRLAPTLQHQCVLAERLFAQGQDQEAQDLLDRALRDHSFAPGPIRWRNRRWARQARRLQKNGSHR
jgi:hypothetical protein